MKLAYLTSLEQLRNHADRWDDLWSRSEVTLPTTRAELLAQWIEQFAPRSRFQAIVVEDGGQWVAALPLVARRRGLGCAAARLPGNDWTEAGDLLLDAGCSDNPLPVLADGLRRSRWSVIHGGGIDAESPRWQAFLEVLHARRQATACRRQFEIGLIDIGADWAAYEASLSGNHRRAVRKSRRRLEAEHPIELEIHRHVTPSEAARLLQEMCEVEDKSWKGQAGTSILRAPGMFLYFQRQAQQLAAWDQLEILFLRQKGVPLAAEYGLRAKGVYHSHKIAYDPDFAFAGPGRLLRGLQLQRYFAEGEFRLVDTLGILSEANAKWSTRKRTANRLVASTGGVAGNSAVVAYARLWPKLKKLLRRDGIRTAEKLGAEEFDPAAESAETPVAVPV